MLRQLQPLGAGTLVLLWSPAVAYAGAVAASGGDASPLAVHSALVAGSLIFSTMAGATTLATSIARELKDKPGQRLVAPWWNAGAHMGGSWLAGSLAFVGSMATNSGVWTLLAAVLVSSFIGAKVLEMAARNIVPGYSPKEQP